MSNSREMTFWEHLTELFVHLRRILLVLVGAAIAIMVVPVRFSGVGLAYETTATLVIQALQDQFLTEQIVLIPLTFFAPLEVYFVLGEEAPTSNEDDEIIRIPQAEQSVDLVDIVRENILLGVPYKVLCHNDCKGLCPVCGQNLNTEPCHCIPRSPDPRWTVLKDLQK